MSKATVKAPSNIAFIKYWGRADQRLFIPLNNSVSMTLSSCTTVTTAETIKGSSDDIQIKFYGKNYQKLKADSKKAINTFNLIQRVRKIAKSNLHVRIRSVNNFPADAGIASSASGFAALTGALLLAYGLHDKFDDKSEYSRQIRMSGSASAARSAYGGFVELLAGDNNQSSFTRQVADEHHWDLVDLIAIIDIQKKHTPSSEGHEAARSSPFLNSRIDDVKKRYPKIIKAIINRDFCSLGAEIERDSLSMHAVMLTQSPSLMYWEPGSISIMKDVIALRDKYGIQAFSTFDAGANAHVICQKKDAKKVQSHLLNNKYIKSLIYNEPTSGAHIIHEHLF